MIVTIHLNLPSSLKVLHLKCCCLETLPLADQQYQLVEIKMAGSKIAQLWHGKKVKHFDSLSNIALTF